MNTNNEVEETLIRYLLYSKAKVLASLKRSDRPGANLKRVLLHLARRNKRSDLDLYTSRAVLLYVYGARNGESLPVILAKIEEHRKYVLGILGLTRRYGWQPFVDSSVYCADHESKIRMLLKSICARQLRIFLLSNRKRLRNACLKSPRSEGFPSIKKKGGWIAPAA
jgi:hypothetical protein